jgi:hypothetical protein
MLEAYNKAITIFILLGLIAYNSSKKLSKKEIDAKADSYRKKYGTISEKKDTTIMHGKLKCIYEVGILTEIGQVKNNQKHGTWYEFDNELRLVSVLHCESDTSCNPIILINTNW